VCARAHTFLSVWKYKYSFALVIGGLNEFRYLTLLPRATAVREAVLSRESTNGEVENCEGRWRRRRRKRRDVLYDHDSPLFQFVLISLCEFIVTTVIALTRDSCCAVKLRKKNGRLRESTSAYIASAAMFPLSRSATRTFLETLDQEIERGKGRRDDNFEDSSRRVRACSPRLYSDFPWRP